MAVDNLSNFGLFDQHLMTPVSSIEDQLTELRKLKERERIVHSQEIFIELYSRQKDELIKIEEGEKAFFNQAWPEEAKTWREAQKLPVHNINVFLPEVQKLIGGEQKNQRDLRILAVERDDEKHAELSTLILKHIGQASQDWYYDQMMFQQGIIAKRGHQELYWDYADDVFGELKCVNRPASQVLRDIDANDPNSLFGDSTVRVHMEWITTRDLERRYKGKEIDWSGMTYTAPHSRDTSGNTQVSGIDDSYEFPCDQYPHYFWKTDKRWIRLIRIWQRDFKTAYRLLDLNPEIETPEQVFVDDFDSEKEAEAAKVQASIDGRDIRYMVIQELQVPYWSYHVISGRTELEWKPDIGRYCPWVDFFAIYLNGRCAGLWDIIEDRQHYINYTNSKLTEAVGRSGQPTVWRENSFVNDINPNTAIRDGQTILVKAEVWDRLNGATPFHAVPNRSLEYIGPLLNWVQEMKGDVHSMSNTGLVPAGASQGGVTAASALAILGQEQQKGTSSYGQNLLFTRALKARLRLYMLAQKFRETPTLIKWKLDKIFGSVISRDDNRELKTILLTKMVDGGIDYDALMRSIRTMKYDLMLDDNLNSLIENQQQLQALQLAAQFGVEPDKETVVDILPLTASIKDKMRKGLQTREKEIEEMMSTPEGQMKLLAQMNQGNRAKNGQNQITGGNNMLNLPPAMNSVVGSA